MKKIFEYSLECSNSKEAINEIGKIMLKNDLIKDAYIKSMHQRNKKISVFMGQGLAIPHGLDNSGNLIKKEGLVIVRMKKPFLWNKKDSESLTYFIIGIAAKRDSQMDILKNLAIKFMDDNFHQKLKKSSKNYFENQF